jgi:hypothetical protein
MVCKFGCPFPVSSADSLDEIFDDFMAYSSAFERRDGRAREFSILDRDDHFFGQVRTIVAPDLGRVSGF